MKFFSNNPFTAPDIKDILHDRDMSLRNLAIVLGSGIVLASTLVGGYHIGQWFLGTVAPATVQAPIEVSAVPKMTVTEQRLAELGGAGSEGTYDVVEATRRIQELNATKKSAAPSISSSTRVSDAQIMEDRIKELGG